MEPKILKPQLTKTGFINKKLIAVSVMALTILLSIATTIYIILSKPPTLVIETPTNNDDTEKTSFTNTSSTEELGSAPEENKFGLVSFTKDDSRNWPMEWHLIMSPEDIETNEFRIISQLKSPKPTGIENAIGFEENILLAVLVNEREIQPEPGDPVNIKFRLSNNTYQNPNGPRGYQYSDLSAGFSRLGGTKNDKDTSTPVLPYGTSFPIFLLGDTIVSKNFFETGDFINSKIVLATIYTNDKNNSYSYEIILEKLPIK